MYTLLNNSARRTLVGVALFALVPLLVLTGCSSSTNPSSTGTMNVYMGDAPADFDAVNIVVTRVEVHMDGTDTTSGWTVVRSDSATFDLLKLRNGARTLLGSTGLVPGHYTQIRLIIGQGSTVTLNGITYPLTIPSGMQTGIKLNNEFDIVAGQTYELLLDFDADHSINETGNGVFMLKPVIRCVALAATGSIAGTVLPVKARTSVWTVEGADTIATVADTTSGLFVLSGLLAGSYTIQFHPADTTYRDTSLTGVAVVNAQQTAVGTVTLRTR